VLDTAYNYTTLINQTTNQPTNQPINQPINQPTNQLVNMVFFNSFNMDT